MDLLLIIFIVIILISAFRGYKSGINIIISRIISIVVAYISAILFTDSFAHWLQQISPIKGLIAYAIAGTILFTITSILLSFALSSLTRMITDGSSKISGASAISGALFGGVTGCFFAILVVWFISSFQGILQVKKGEEVVVSSFQKATQTVVAGAIKGIVGVVSDDSDIATGAAQLLSNPAENIQHFNRLSKQGVLRNLLQDNVVRAALDSQDPQTLLNSVAFQQLLDNSDFIALTKSLDLSEIKQERDNQIAFKITKTWAQINQVQNDPEYLELMQDPEVKQGFQTGNLFKLMNSEKVERLLKIISSSETPQIKLEDIRDNNYPFQTKETKIYRWVDDDGKVHYSDKNTKRDE